MPNYLLRTLCAVVGFVLSVSATAAVRDVQKIVATGDTPPGGAGTPLFFETLQTGMINNNGEVAFQGSIDNPVGDLLYKNGIWVKSNGSFEERVRAGELAPGAPNGVFPKFTAFRNATLNDAGVVGYLGNTDVNDHRAGYWTSSTSTTEAIAVEGTAAGSLSADLDGIFYEPSLNNAGQMAFNSWIIPHGSTTLRSGIFIADADEFGIVSLEGEPAPGTSNNFAGISRHYPPINGSGETAFSLALKNSTTGIEDGRAVYRGNSSSLELVAHTGMAAPGTGATFSSNSYTGTIPLNSAGDVAFASGLSGAGVNGQNDFGLWRTRGESLELVARRGDMAPSGQLGEQRFWSFNSPLIDDSDQVVFKASMSIVQPVVQTNLWSARDGELNLIAAMGMTAPGTGDVFTYVAPVGSYAANSLGQIAFQARAGLMDGIWAQDPSGAVRLIARVGDTVELATGDVREIASFDPLYLSNGSDGKSRSFNDAGQLVFNATFVGGGEGIFVSDVAGYYLADFDRDGDVDTYDLIDWRSAYAAGTADGDADGDGVSSGRDFLIWQRQMGLGTLAGSTAVPEPGSAMLLVIGCLALGNRRTTGCIRASFRCNTRGKQRG
jgi:hypothetical protein